MKVGDLVVYKYIGIDKQTNLTTKPALVLLVNNFSNTLKVLKGNGEIDWYVTRYCEVISA